jgi:hypothetical protein
MAKRKITTQLPDVQKEHYLITKAGVKVYPVYFRGKWFIEIDNNGTIQRFEKSVAQQELNHAIHNTILYCFKRLKDNGDKHR